MSKIQKDSVLYVVISAILVSWIFILDLVFSLSLASGILYMIPVLISLRSSKRYYIITITIISTIFIILGFFNSFATNLSWETLANHLFALFVIWVVAILCIYHKRVREDLIDLFTALEAAGEAILITDTDGTIQYVNPAFESITGYTREEIIGQNSRILKSGKQDETLYYEMWETLTRGEVWRGLLTNRKKDGTLYDVEETIAPVRNSSGRTIRYVAIERDVTERKRVEETIRYLAYYDALTNLPNRMLFNDRLTLALSHARRSRQMLAVMFLDLDQFKIINDTLGHTLGDKLLQGVAQRLTNCLREGDTVARLGGDEFALLLVGITRIEDATRVAQKILEILKPIFSLEGHEFHITTSIGIALYPSDGEDVQTLLKNADTAMYHAKAQGRNNYQFHTATMNSRVFERLTMENSLRRALEREELLVYYQPQLSLNTGQVVGIEALVRWQHSNLGPISPAQFIPLAEETGLIVAIDEWVLQTACIQNRIWQEAGFPPLRMAVNLSAHHFRQRNLIETVAKILEETNLDPKQLDLELTESTIMENAEKAITTLHELKTMGIRLSVDDFGTGYSSLSYLKRFPIDILKIDQSFIRDITTDPNNAAIASLIIAMAHSLKLKVIAEGVETNEQLAFLNSEGCDEIQGYLFSQPLSAETFTILLQKGQLLLSTS